VTSRFHWGTFSPWLPLQFTYYQPLKQNSNEFKNKEKHLDTDSESNITVATAVAGALGLNACI